LSHCSVTKKQCKRVQIGCALTSRNHKRRKKSPQDGHAMVELDSHADAAVFGMACHVINDTGALVSVDGCEPANMNLDGVHIVTVSVAYDCSVTMHPFILFIHQVTHVTTLTRHLISPFQMCEYGITVNEVALMHLPESQWTPDAHSMLVDNPLLHIPLTFDGGTMSGFTVRSPTDEELQDYDQNFTTHVTMTSPDHWEPWSN
jgi:hypothetical protein